MERRRVYKFRRSRLAGEAYVQGLFVRYDLDLAPHPAVCKNRSVPEPVIPRYLVVMHGVWIGDAHDAHAVIIRFLPV
jgi:hypothetical protein